MVIIKELPKPTIKTATETLTPVRVSFIISDSNNDKIKRIRELYLKEYKKPVTRTLLINLALNELFTEKEEEEITQILKEGVTEHD